MYAVVLNQAEESAYDDQEWRLYHFPRTYRSNIKEGSRFVYYRPGARCYFGMGRIGRVWRDPLRSDHWYAELVGAREFPRLVFYQDRLGRYLERRPEIRRPAFQRSARWIDREVYDRILYGSWLWAVVINGEAFRRELAGGAQRAAALVWVRRQKEKLSAVGWPPADRGTKCPCSGASGPGCRTGFGSTTEPLAVLGTSAGQRSSGG